MSRVRPRRPAAAVAAGLLLAALASCSGNSAPEGRTTTQARTQVDGDARSTADTAMPAEARSGTRTSIGAPANVGTAEGGTPVEALVQSASEDATALIGGEMIYMADAARLTDCASGASFPIAMEGDFARAERPYLESAPEPGAPLYVTFFGVVAERPGFEPRSGPVPMVIVQDFVDAWPNQRCEQARTHAPLANTTWRITRLGDQAVRPGEANQPRRYIVLRDADQTYSATVGCNQLAGSYTLDGDEIALRNGATTLMACPPPLEDLEHRLVVSLTQAARLRIHANTLLLEDAAGNRVAPFEAIPEQL